MVSLLTNAVRYCSLKVSGPILICLLPSSTSICLHFALQGYLLFSTYTHGTNFSLLSSQPFGPCFNATLASCDRARYWTLKIEDPESFFLALDFALCDPIIRLSSRLPVQDGGTSKYCVKSMTSLCATMFHRAAATHVICL